MNGLSIIENGLIPIYQSEKGTRLVNMRELHTWLEVGRDFSTWVKDRIEKYGFAENQDFMLFPNSGENSEGRPRLDYIFKLEPAKEIAMVENNEKGKEIRRYFIQVEEKFKQLQCVEDLIILQAQSMKELRAEVKQLSNTQQAIREAVICEPDNWREDIYHKINKISQAIGPDKFRDIRKESYGLLESRAHVDLKRRLLFYRARLLDQGKSKSMAEKANNIDVIEQDPKLREIYGKIVSEFLIKYVA